MEKKREVIIIAILTLAVFDAGTFVLLSSQSDATPLNNTLSQQGTKIELKNNNLQQWEHMDITIPNAAYKDGSTHQLYIQTWIKPGESTTIDLSNILGYGNAPLPAGTAIRMKIRSGLFNTNPGGNGSFNLTMQGWSGESPSSNPPNYKLNFSPFPIGQLPSSMTTSTVNIGAASTDVEFTGYKPSDPLFTDMIITVAPSGNIIMSFINGI